MLIVFKFLVFNIIPRCFSAIDRQLLDVVLPAEESLNSLFSTVWPTIRQ